MKLLFLALLFCCTSYAGGGGVETSGGGTGVLVDDQIELLDLVESGVNTKEITSPYPALNHLLLPLEKFDLKSDVDLTLLGAFINLISTRDPYLADGITKTILLYRWAFTSTPLKEQFPQTIINAPLHQIALRKGAFVYIDQTLFKKMAPAQRVALVIHEALSALSTPDAPESRTRQIVGLLFSKNFQNQTAYRFADLLGLFYISEASVRRNLTEKFKNSSTELSVLSQNAPMIHSTPDSEVAQIEHTFGFFPTVEYSSDVLDDVNYQFRISSYQMHNNPKPLLPACDGSPRTFSILMQYYTIEVALPFNENAYAPHASWSISRQVLRVVPFSSLCTPEMMKALNEGLNSLETNFTDR